MSYFSTVTVFQVAVVTDDGDVELAVVRFERLLGGHLAAVDSRCGRNCLIDIRVDQLLIVLALETLKVTHPRDG